MSLTRSQSRAAMLAQGCPEDKANDLLGPERAPRRPRPGRIPEKDVLASLMLYLRHHPQVKRESVTRMNVIGGRSGRGRSGRRGMFDIWATLKDGRALWVEVKADDGVVSDEQWSFKAMVSGPHQLAIVARCVADLKMGGLE